MQDFTTPMMKQYEQIKKKYQDCLLFYRMGDFYELFLEDAYIGAQILDITLTSRPKGKDGRIPMAGVPYHAVDSYIAKLVKSGKKVAICEQLSPPNKRGIIEREVIRIVTPGTMLDEKALDKKEHNYIVSLAIGKNELAITAADISTGYFATMQTTTTNFSQTISDELSKLHPSECIVPEELYNNPQLLKLLTDQQDMNIYSYKEWYTFAGNAKKVLQQHFGVTTLSSFGIDKMHYAQTTAAALLGYLQYTQKDTISHISTISHLQTPEHMVMDRSTMINLELFATIRDHDTKATLLNVLDQTHTAMGGRLLKEWIKKPLTSKKEITRRHDSVDELIKKSSLYQHIQELLGQTSDIERLSSRLSVGIGNARDIVNVKNSLLHMLAIKKLLVSSKSVLLKEIAESISPSIEKITKLIETTFVDEPPIDVKSGGMIREGISRELDTLHITVTSSKQWLLDFEKKEREKSGIGSLKVRYNQVFGFYIEISKANTHLAPSHYMRKQTLVNGERFTTKELKEQEEIILTAEEKMNTLEYTIFTEVLAKILEKITLLQQAAQAIAILDCLSTFAFVSQKNTYVRPTILYSGEVNIIQGRHPVVEQLLDSHTFVPNDVHIGNAKEHLILLTGPNMAGKSVFIRQVALICLMNQIGCFVPAQKAYLSLVDRIFVRSGASDVITSGLSTFMVEMVETAHILRHATHNSLIVMDEIGRGTSTYDGISIAWSVAQYLVTHFKPSPKTLFATHYHELQALEKEYPKKIKNYSMSVTEHNGEPVFLHTITPVGASHSFGVAVAKLAGVPEEVITKAKDMLESLEQRNQTHDVTVSPLSEQSESKGQSNVLRNELKKLDISNLTPLQALNILASMKARSEEI